MQRKYVINWYKNEYNPNSRQTLINLSNPSGKTNHDTRAALEIFKSMNGSLKQNTIINIQEFDENGNQIGKDITPAKNKEIFI